MTAVFTSLTGSPKRAGRSRTIARDDRATEFAVLRRLARGDQPTLALLYGRRRVGKTYFVDRACDGRRSLYFLAADTTAELNRQELLREVRRVTRTNTDLDTANSLSWRAVFRLLADLASEESLIVVLDEFQNLLAKDDDVVSQLVAVWDDELRGRPLMLVLCGSEVAAMERLAARGGPLYDRLSWTAQLRALDYYDTAVMLPGLDPRDSALFYGILGGTPRFLAAIQSGDLIADRVIESVLSPRGEVHLHLERTVEQEKGIREPAEYRALLAAMASSKKELEEIVHSVGLGDRANAVRRVAVLEKLELIERERNLDAHEKAAWRYEIADLAVLFWHRFVQPNRSLLETGGLAGAREVWKRGVEPLLDDYMDIVFERICRDGFLRHHDDWGLAGPACWARWEGMDRNRRPIELDVVARLDDGRILTGDVEWSSQPMDLKTHTNLLHDLEALGASGYGWAKDAISATKCAGHLYFSATGFTDTFRQHAAKTASVHLLSLDDLYPANNRAEHQVSR